MRDLTYPPIVATCKAVFRGLGHRFRIEGTHHIPRTGGVLLAVNHTGYVDFIYGGYAAERAGRKLRFMAKKELFDNRFSGPLMRSMHHIAVDRGTGAGSLRTAMEYLRRGEAVGIYPEATVSRAMELKDFKTGAARIAAEAGVPLVPVVVWGTQRMLTKEHKRDFSRGKAITILVGEPLHPAGADSAADTAELKASMTALLDDAIRNDPDRHLHPGAWWVPASYGGSAPSLEEATARELAEKRRRAERRAAKRVKK